MNNPSQETGFTHLLRRRLSRLRHRLLYQFSPQGRASQARLAALRDSHRGERCFIIGNGPSLRQTDLTRLRDEYTFGLNRIYLLYPQLGFSTTYLVTVNWLVLEQCLDEILAVPTTKFLPWSFHGHLTREQSASTIFVNCDGARGTFSTEARKPLWQGTTVTYVAIQLAYQLGFQKAILIGVDHSFTAQGKPHETVVSQGDDPNHFSPDYFGKGFRWQLPDLETSELAYRLARQVFAAGGREIVDATIGGKLTVFPKVEYSSLF